MQCNSYYVRNYTDVCLYIHVQERYQRYINQVWTVRTIGLELAPTLTDTRLGRGLGSQQPFTLRTARASLRVPLVS